MCLQAARGYGLLVKEKPIGPNIKDVGDKDAGDIARCRGTSTDSASKCPTDQPMYWQSTTSFQNDRFDCQGDQQEIGTLRRSEDALLFLKPRWWNWLRSWATSPLLIPEKLAIRTALFPVTGMLLLGIWRMIGVSKPLD